MTRLVCLLTLVAACGGGEPDGRVVSTLYTGTCDWSGNEWLGVERVQVAVEYAPGNLADRSLPTLTPGKAAVPGSSLGLAVTGTPDGAGTPAALVGRPTD